VFPYQTIESRLRQALLDVLPDADVSNVQVRPCPDPKFGDYQAAALMSLAKARKMNPRQLAESVLAKLNVKDLCEPVQVAGAGFLNFHLLNATLAGALSAAARGEHLFFEPAAKPKTVVLDFSSPNVAKPMHVGHIRSTILGDAMARTLRLLGHKVITDNHLGDWGTQFGKLIVGWKQHLDQAALQTNPISEMERLYKLVNAATESDPAVLELARKELVKLQGGDEENQRIWREMTRLSQSQFDAVYQRLGIKFDHTFGESFYNPRLEAIVRGVMAKGIARESEGAIVAFFDDHPRLKNTPSMVRKQDGGFNYTTTDLATLEYRLQTWHPDEIAYFVGAPQQLHFQQLFELFRRWHPDVKVRLEHVSFGSILGPDGKPFKTRSGETVRLSDLLDEAETRAFDVVTTKSPELPESDRRTVARSVGLGAIKYADLAQNRETDYLFNWEKMLALQGNTAPYLLYAYARIRSIFRKGQEGPGEGRPALRSASDEGGGEEAKAIQLGAPQEIALARHLLNFGLVLEAMSTEYRPNYLCSYLYELAGLFTGFYENCPVLKSSPAERASRLALCDVTARVLKTGLECLGIEPLERM
jgi:arginyl-tRNA synthetase